MEEIWRPIAEFEGYDVSNCGRVRSWKTSCPHVRSRSPKIKSLTLDRQGYLVASLSEKDVTFKRFVHRLVAVAFIPGDHALEVAHLDNVKTNNSVQNLKWCTRAENESHKLIFGTLQKGEGHVSSKLTDREVTEIADRIRSGERPAIVAKEYGISACTARRYAVTGTRIDPYRKKVSA